MSFLISLSREWDMPEFTMLRVYPQRHLALLKNVTDYSFKGDKWIFRVAKIFLLSVLKTPCAY